MNRRELFGAAIGGATFAIASSKAFADEQEHEGHMDHTAHANLQHAKLSEAARNCVSAGDL
jgi:hypothetical protein